MAHSPDRSKYKEYMKPRKHLPRPLRMPFWEIDELETLRAKCFEGKVTHEEVRQPDLCTLPCICWHGHT